MKAYLPEPRRIGTSSAESDLLSVRLPPRFGTINHRWLTRRRVSLSSGAVVHAKTLAVHRPALRRLWRVSVRAHSAASDVGSVAPPGRADCAEGAAAAQRHEALLRRHHSRGKGRKDLVRESRRGRERD